MTSQRSAFRTTPLATPLSALLASLLMTFAMGASAAPMNKAEYKTGKADVSTQYKAAKKACDAQTGNAKDICIEEAKGVEKVALAELDANYEPSTKHTAAVSTAKAKAAFAVAKEKCDDQTGNPKDVCRKEAEATYTTAMAQSKVTEKKTDNNSAAADKNAAAQKTANTDVMDAQYKVAAEKCDAMTGDAKGKCVSDAKTKFGK